MSENPLRTFALWLVVAALSHNFQGPSTSLAQATGPAEPGWIWGAAGAAVQAEDGHCVFRKPFAVPGADGQIESATLQITADDQYVLRLNGRLVGVDADWNSIEQYDVRELLKVGENELLIVARNLQGPAGLWLSLDIAFTNGPAIRVSSDASWQARMQTSGSWDPHVADAVGWDPAYVLRGDGGPLPWQGATRLVSEVHHMQRRGAAHNGAFELHDGDRVLWLGNTLIEREQRYGYWETALTARYPRRNLLFRNLGWSGDTVFGEARARFGTAEQGFEHLEVHVHAVRPTVILIAYGTNESFAGKPGLPEFQAGLYRLLDALESTGARLVLLSPMKQETLGDPLPDAAARNAEIDRYRDVIRSVAGERGHDFVDLGQLTSRPSPGEVMSRPLTDNGMHLTELGYWYTAPLVQQGLGIGSVPWQIDVDASDGTYDAVGTSLAELQVDRRRVQFTALDRNLPRCPAPEAVPDLPFLPSSRRLVRIRGLDGGRYQLRVDDSVVATADHGQWARGVTIERGPEFFQVEQLRQTIRAKNELYFHRWRPENETYLFLFRKHEQGNNAIEIPQFDPLIDQKEAEIAQLRIPVARRYQVFAVD